MEKDYKIGQMVLILANKVVGKIREVSLSRPSWLGRYQVRYIIPKTGEVTDCWFSPDELTHNIPVALLTRGSYS